MLLLYCYWCCWCSTITTAYLHPICIHDNVRAAHPKAVYDSHLPRKGTCVRICYVTAWWDFAISQICIEWEHDNSLPTKHEKPFRNLVLGADVMFRSIPVESAFTVAWGLSKLWLAAPPPLRNFHARGILIIASEAYLGTSAVFAGVWFNTQSFWNTLTQERDFWAFVFRVIDVQLSQEMLLFQDVACLV